MSEGKLSGLINVQRTGDQNLQFIKALVCGAPGTGKTLFASTAPDPFIINTDHGLASLRERNVPFATVPDTKEDIEEQNVSKFIGQILAILQGGEGSMKKHLGVVPKTIVVDTFDMIVGLLVKEYLKANKQTALKIQDYSWLKERLKALTGGFRNLDMNVVFTCHLKDKSDDDGATSRTVPAVDGSFAEDIPGWFDLAVVLKNEVVTDVANNKMNRTVRKYMQTFPDPPKLDWVKDRFGKLPQEFDLNLEDDFSRIQALVFANDTTDKAA